MKLNYKNSKKIGTILGIVLFIGLIAGITYAVFNWRSTNTNISVNTKCFQVEGSSSYTVQGSNMLLFDEDDIIDEENGTITYKNGMLYYPFTVSRDSSCNTDVHYEIIVHITELSEDYRNGALKYKLIDDMSSYTSQQISNPLNEELNYNYLHSKNFTNIGDYIIYQDNVSSNSTITSAVVFYLDGDLVLEDASDLAFSASIEVIALNGKVSDNAVDYINYLYNSVPKTLVTNHNIDYNYAKDVSLMNDRHASMNKDINGGNIRYYGSNPNNYVWLGDTYTSEYSITKSGKNGNFVIKRQIGDKKLWRIIGVFDGRVKLIQNDPISTNLSWDTSASSVNGGSGINQWGESTYSDTGNVYKGADLMRLLNPGFEDNIDLDKYGNTVTVNNSLYWTKGTGTVYSNASNTLGTKIQDFSNLGMSSGEKNMIDTVTWYLGAVKGKVINGGTRDLYSDDFYLGERQVNSLGKTCSLGVNCNDTVNRTATWNGMVGLMYPSDFGYAVDFSLCDSELRGYGYYAVCRDNDWLNYCFPNTYTLIWTITPFKYDSSDKYANMAFVISESGDVYGDYAYKAGKIFPTVYLKPNVIITSGDGTESDPFVLSLE